MPHVRAKPPRILTVGTLLAILTAVACLSYLPARSEGGVYGPPPPPESWTETEIKAARAQCDELLRDGGIVFEPAAPLRNGACGTPAPIRVSAIEPEKGDTIKLTPPALLTCKLAADLKRWLAETVTPKAKAYFDARVSGLQVAASYDCRFRNGDQNKRISQHALANAIDIAAFELADGQTVSVEDHWAGSDDRAKFLGDAHQGACQVFGTTLGPNADAAHKSHFHLDAMARKHQLLCDVVHGSSVKLQGVAAKKQ